MDPLYQWLLANQGDRVVRVDPEIRLVQFHPIHQCFLEIQQDQKFRTVPEVLCYRGFRWDQ